MADSALPTIVGAGVGIIGLIVAKEGKVSEFRQAWIDSLRDDLAKLCANALHLHGTKPEQEWIRELNEICGRVALRLNTRDDDATELLLAVDKLRDAGQAGVHSKEINIIANEVVITGNVVIRSTWKRVKRGEPTYQLVLYAAMLALLIGLGSAAYPWARLHICR